MKTKSLIIYIFFMIIMNDLVSFIRKGIIKIKLVVLVPQSWHFLFSPLAFKRFSVPSVKP